MAAIKDSVARFVTNQCYTEWDHAIAMKWLDATRCSEIDARLLADNRSNLSKEEAKLRTQIKSQTIAFAKRYFDDRPNVVRSLDFLFAEFGLSNEHDRREEFFPFDKVYRHDEVSVLLLKHLQPVPGRERYTREHIAEYFLTTDRTIGEYIRALQPMVDAELSARIFGQIVRLDPIRRTNVPESTTHPLFLPLNMVELYTLVDMLVQHSEDEVEGRIVQSILKRTLDQTTGYAKERLARIYGFSEALTAVSHLDEQQGPGEAVVFSEKEGIRAVVHYMESGKEKACKGRISRNYRDRAVIDVIDNDSVWHIPYRDIIYLKPSCE